MRTSRANPSPRNRRQYHQKAVSYVVKTPDVLGRFDVAKAKALNVPPGPLYGSEAGRGRHARRWKRRPGLASRRRDHTRCVRVLALFVATPGALQRLRSKLQAFLTGSASLDCIVHMAPPQIAASEAYLAFSQSFPASIQQLWTQAGASPFRTAARDAQTISARRAGLLHSSDVAEASTEAWSGPGVQVETTGRFTLVPRSQAGYVAPEVVEDDLEAEWAEVKERGLDAALEAVASAKTTEVPSQLQHAAASLASSGTGSAMPSKHRNVSGIYLRCAAETTDVSDPGRGLLLDCGEGTLGQLRRAFGNRADECLRNLGAVWISHPHADHHLGLPSLLAERRRLAPEKPSPILDGALAGPAVARRLRGRVCASEDAYVPVECQWMKEDAPHPQQQRLTDDLRLSQCFCVPVPHCAQAYGVVVKAVDGWSLCYSGDCRPSTKLAAAPRTAPC